MRSRNQDRKHDRLYASHARNSASPRRRPRSIGRIVPSVPTMWELAPVPRMIHENTSRMKVYPLEAIVKVYDTMNDLEEGLNAGTWSVAVAQTGNMIGVKEEAVAGLA